MATAVTCLFLLFVSLKKSFIWILDAVPTQKSQWTWGLYLTFSSLQNEPFDFFICPSILPREDNLIPWQIPETACLALDRGRRAWMRLKLQGLNLRPVFKINSLMFNYLHNRNPPSIPIHGLNKDEAGFFQTKPSRISLPVQGWVSELFLQGKKHFFKMIGSQFCIFPMKQRRFQSFGHINRHKHKIHFWKVTFTLANNPSPGFALLPQDKTGTKLFQWDLIGSCWRT